MFWRHLGATNNIVFGSGNYVILIRDSTKCIRGTLQISVSHIFNVAASIVASVVMVQGMYDFSHENCTR